MTFVQGMEFNCYKQFEEFFEIPYYYKGKGKPWQMPKYDQKEKIKLTRIKKHTFAAHRK